MNLPLALMVAVLQGYPPPAIMPKQTKPTWTNVKATFYQPNQGKSNRPHLDRTGGGPNGGWTGTKLMGYHCAVGGSIKLGSLLWCGSPVNKLLLAVDTGSAVRGKHIDVCIPDPREYRKYMHLTTRVNVWKIKILTKKEARKWKPNGIHR